MVNTGPFLNFKFFNFSVSKTVQDGDLAIHHCTHAVPSVDDQCGPEGCLLSHQSGSLIPQIPWVPLAQQEFRTPFGLSLAPRAFTKTLAPFIAWLRLLGVQLYAYLDDLLIVGDSPLEVTESVEKTIQVLTQAGFIVNLKKCDLSTPKNLLYIGVRICTRLYLSESRIQILIACVQSFSKVGMYKPAHLFLSLLELMAATLQLVEYAHLHMSPIQWYLKWHWNHVTHGLCHPVFVMKDRVLTLRWWTERNHVSQEMASTFSTTTITITMDRSMEGWRRHCCVPGSGTALFSNLWTCAECQFHINVLELRAVRLTL